MGQGRKKHQPVNYNITKTITSSQQDDLTGHKEDEVILEEAGFPVIVFWFK